MAVITVGHSGSVLVSVSSLGSAGSGFTITEGKPFTTSELMLPVPEATLAPGDIPILSQADDQVYEVMMWYDDERVGTGGGGPGGGDNVTVGYGS